MHTLAHCCLQGVCCAPRSEEQIAEMGTILERFAEKTAKDEGLDGKAQGNYFRAMARYLLEEADAGLVPAAIADAIHESFQAALKLKTAHGKTGVGGEGL